TLIPIVPSSSSISFRLPSETEMINALAIYLTSRVKQEAVLWFFDLIRQDAKKDSLLRMAFPETTHLLLSEDVYETPNMGSAWRYALSKDFVSLPRQITESGWFRQRLNDNDKGAI